MFQRNLSKIFILAIFLGLAFSADAQRPKKVIPAKKTPVKKAEAPSAEAEISEKKNTRPDSQTEPTETPTPGKKNSKTEIVPRGLETKQNKIVPVYFYQFERPGFVVEKIFIEHDDAGNGTIRFMKMYYEEEIEDPLKLSSETAEKLKMLWQNVGFLETQENYQYEKDYTHLGNLTLTAKRNGTERKTSFNWTVNQDAKALADEYRKISNQYIWTFDMNLSRENQPLESSKILDQLDSLLQRTEIADPEQMLPYLVDLGNDERIPLLSRNHAKRIVVAIEKKLAKKKEGNQ